MDPRSVVDLVSLDTRLGVEVLFDGRLYAGLSLMGRWKLAAAPFWSVVMYEGEVEEERMASGDGAAWVAVSVEASKIRLESRLRMLEG